MRFFLARIIVNQYRSSYSPFHIQFRKFRLMVDEDVMKCCGGDCWTKKFEVLLTERVLSDEDWKRNCKGLPGNQRGICLASGHLHKGWWKGCQGQGDNQHKVVCHWQDHHCPLCGLSVIQETWKEVGCVSYDHQKRMSENQENHFRRIQPWKQRNTLKELKKLLIE